MDASVVAADIPQPGPSEQADPLSTWVRRAQAGDSSAFETLVERTRGLVRKTAYPLLRDDQVEDVVQETYLIAYQKLHHLRDPQAFQGWLVRIALHVTYSVRKKTPLLAEPDQHVSSPDSTLAATQRLDLKSALSLLKEDDRNILILREMLQLSYDEISMALRLPVGTVRSRIHYGRKKLAELLQPAR